MKNRIIYILVGLMMLLPVLSSCNDTDDVAEIFTGKSWKLTYITKSNSHGWYKFDNVTEDNLMEYIEGEKTFTLVFAGTVTDNVISGIATGSGSVKSSGNWNANAKNQDFSMTLTTGTAVDSNDNVAKRILEGLKNAYTYKGSDSNNLYLYYKPDLGSETFCMVFARN